MNAESHPPARSVAFHILEALACVFPLAGLGAIVLVNFFHGQRSDFGTGNWDYEFVFGTVHVAPSWILAGLILLFVGLPIVIGAVRASHTYERRFDRPGQWVLFGLILCVGIVFNLLVFIFCSCIHWNSSKPF
ncbi:MAG: hypothetical protein ABJF10_17670 [Chthoniobacter sp.]|uniref:hypothetical protein n=1 Tax=Chthoniobacter sp. TaxID=2510640 RepID=UPI0032A56F95